MTYDPICCLWHHRPWYSSLTDASLHFWWHIRGSALEWNCSYLSDRMQAVNINGFFVIISSTNLRCLPSIYVRPAFLHHIHLRSMAWKCGWPLISRNWMIRLGLAPYNLLQIQSITTNSLQIALSNIQASYSAACDLELYLNNILSMEDLIKIFTINLFGNQKH